MSSKNLSRTLFYEFYKSDPNLIYKSVEEYRNFKSDPDFADKTIEEYRRVKALETKETVSMNDLAAGEEESSSDESQNDCATNEIASTTSDNEIETIKDNEPEPENEIGGTEENMVDEIQIAISELQVESSVQEKFQRSLEQFWTRDETEDTPIFDSRSPSICSSENLSRLASASELTSNRSKKRTKSKFKIPKSQSTINLRKVKSRYMDVFKKPE